MTTMTIAPVRLRTWPREALILLGLAGLTALGARVAIPLPWTPVPATLQVAGVIFAGAAFGARRGLLSQLLYLTAGLAGLPVFAEPLLGGPAVLLLPTFGYLVSFPLAAFLAGRWTEPRKRWLGAALGLVAIYGIGGLWLFAWAALSGQNPSIGWTLLAGVLPFLPFDILKAAAAVWSAGLVRRRPS